MKYLLMHGLVGTGKARADRPAAASADFSDVFSAAPRPASMKGTSATQAPTKGSSVATILGLYFVVIGGGEANGSIASAS